MGPFLSRPSHNNQLQTVKDHLLETGDLAGQALAALASFHPQVVALAQAAGRWHDLGKFNPQWQKYLRQCQEGHKQASPGHARQGALLAWNHRCFPVAHAILGHHAGLYDTNAIYESKGADTLKTKLKDPQPWQDIQSIAEGEINDAAFFQAPDYLPDRLDPYYDELLTRIIFSALIDADRQSVARFFGEETAPRRPDLQTLGARLQTYVETLQAKSEPNPINAIRREIYQLCQGAALQKAGFFRLTTPTGAGKTLSVLRWALDHALHNGQQRIIYCPPFTSIIEQTADIYRQACGEDAVLEHHSGVIPDGEEELRTYQIGAQRWDYPLIVTTTVQLFTSLFSHYPSACRKVHRIPNSVIILDEVQSLPSHCLAPILKMLGELAKHWGCSVVFCSATQPWYEIFQEELKIPPILDLIRPSTRLRHFGALNQRTRYEYQAAPWTWADLLADFENAPENSALIVVNSKKAARQGFEALSSLGYCYHLSRNLYPQHRRRVIAAVKERLQSQLPTVLVSTQLIEAGVDLDFQRGYRVITGLDSLIQTAGRVNRQSRYPQSVLKIIHLVDAPTLRSDQARIAHTEALLQEGRDPNQEAVCQAYFTRLFSAQHSLDGAFDKRGINALRAKYAFRTIGQKFELIDEDSGNLTVIIAQETEPQTLIGKLQNGDGLSAQEWRRLYQYGVQVLDNPSYRQQIQDLGQGVSLWQGGYDPDCGLIA